MIKQYAGTDTHIRAKKSITLEKEIETTARKIQAKMIEQTNQNWSLSTILNILLAAGINQTRHIDKNQWNRIVRGVKDKTIRFDDSAITAFIKKATT